MQKYLPSTSFRRGALVAPFLLLAFGIAHTSDAATITYLINFGDSSYTSDGTNTWNAPTVTFFENVTIAGNEISLVDTSNADHGLDLAVTFRGATQPGWILYNANSQATWPSLPWFDSTVAQQRAYLNVDDIAEERWVISGFDPTDTVNVQWIAQHHNTGSRSVTFEIAGTTSNVIGGNAVTSLNYQTATGVNDNTFLEWNVTPDAGGELEFHIDATGTVHGSWGNAMRIVVTTLDEDPPVAIPEPDTIAMATVALAFLSLVARRRRSR